MTDWSRTIFFTSVSVTVIAGSFLYGVYGYRNAWPPVPAVIKLHNTVREVISPSDSILETTTAPLPEPVATLLPDALEPGLVAMAAGLDERIAEVRVIDRAGNLIHTYATNWTEIWPDGEGDFPRRPVQDMYLHGVGFLPDGSLVANFDHQSTFRMDVCGEILWKLENLGHHSIHIDKDSTIWVPAEIRPSEAPMPYPLHQPQVLNWTLEKISPDGEILKTVPILELLMKAGYEGLLFMSDLNNLALPVTGDTLHLNDVEVFPEGMDSTLFAPGDVMLSLRNIHTIIVFDADLERVKFVSSGRVMRHHDPDFAGGNRISIFDNRSFTKSDGLETAASRIVEIDAATGELSVLIDGADPEVGFYTEIMGMHQRLPGGNILVTSAGEGRVLEYTADGKLAWRFQNQTEGGDVWRAFWAEVLPPQLDKTFFEEAKSRCGN
ncbi:arylsulfotransferase family protein [Aliiruegeria lutimaris]|uniref:Arylsulfotransferase (ASST) n=1 Tax=Aliiruegeria lutimaris TaxID=571298 RepID=A0A1G8T3Q3_9RHOB|nr:arylsulfotransferase family protein [Aliiruegeria lutimaris]SDJ36037.1 Arylsulfotransferase (ASST) [Aliiruegeria lutimaris]